LSEVIAALKDFLMPPTIAAVQEQPFEQLWVSLASTVRIKSALRACGGAGMNHGQELRRQSGNLVVERIALTALR
jgi:hypothetical protein